MQIKIIFITFVYIFLYNKHWICYPLCIVPLPWKSSSIFFQYSAHFWTYVSILCYKILWMEYLLVWFNGRSCLLLSCFLYTHCISYSPCILYYVIVANIQSWHMYPIYKHWKIDMRFMKRTRHETTPKALFLKLIHIWYVSSTLVGKWTSPDRSSFLILDIASCTSS